MQACLVKTQEFPLCGIDLYREFPDLKTVVLYNPGYVLEICNINEFVICIWREQIGWRDFMQAHPEEPIRCMIDLITHRCERGLPTGVIYDFSHEGWSNPNHLRDVVVWFSGLGLNCKQDLLMLYHSNHSTKQPQFDDSTYRFFPWILEYNWPAVDALYWLGKRPDKFSALPLKHRPNLISITASKLRQKNWRTWTIYEFYRQGLFPYSLLSICGTVNEFAELIDDREFLDQIDQRISVFGIDRAQNLGTSIGSTNMQNGSETSTRSLYAHSRIHCILETSGQDVLNGHIYCNARLTEKFYRTVANRSAFTVLGAKGIYQLIDGLGFQTFEPLITEYLNFDHIPDPKEKCQRIVELTGELRRQSDSLLDRMQEIADYNFEHFYSDAVLETKRYHTIIDQFIDKLKTKQRL